MKNFFAIALWLSLLPSLSHGSDTNVWDPVAMKSSGIWKASCYHQPRNEFDDKNLKPEHFCEIRNNASKVDFGKSFGFKLSLVDGTLIYNEVGDRINDYSGCDLGRGGISFDGIRVEGFISDEEIVSKILASKEVAAQMGYTRWPSCVAPNSIKRMSTDGFESVLTFSRDHLTSNRSP